MNFLCVSQGFSSLDKKLYYRSFIDNYIPVLASAEMAEETQEQTPNLSKEPSVWLNTTVSFVLSEALAKEILTLDFSLQGMLSW